MAQRSSATPPATCAAADASSTPVLPASTSTGRGHASWRDRAGVTLAHVRAREVEKRIKARGGTLVRQRGSHRLFEVALGGLVARTTVPYHGGDVPKGTLRAIERDLEPVLGKGWLR
ncbi:type II toxin-antitoxin system HicA family toxin [Microcella pacifica]|uniref:type II toxin-antitoxin system HicA family toxin n=1 Tax=Microcella pacifica TaxID=2591847 RepID=UPI0038B3BC6F